MKTCPLDRHGVTLTYDDRGAGRPLLLVHAFPFDRTMWQPQADELAKSARVLMLDLPGFGGSTPAAWTVDSAADLIADFLTAVGLTGKVVVGGLSMGGYVAMAVARRHPERLAGLILADTRGEPDDEAGKQKRAAAISVAEKEGAAGLTEQNLPSLLGAETKLKRPEVVETVRRIAGRQSTAGTVAGVAAMRDRPDAGPGLEKVAVPTLIIVGEHDAITPPTAAAAMAAKVRGSRLVTIPGVGHMSNLENPAAFTTAVAEFLNGLR